MKSTRLPARATILRLQGTFLEKGKMPGLPIHHQLLELAQTHVHQVSEAIQPSHPRSSPSLPTFSHSQHQGFFQWVSFSYPVAKVLSFSFSISPSNEYSELISLRMDWLDLLSVQGTLKRLLQWVSFLLQAAKILEFQLQHQSLQWIFRTDFL